MFPTWGASAANSTSGSASSGGGTRKPPPETLGSKNQPDRLALRRSPQVHAELVGSALHHLVGLEHERLELPQHLLFGPVIALQVLHPFEVACGYPARVGEDVRKHHHSLFEKRRVSLGCGGAVGELQDVPGADLCSVAGQYLVIKGCRDEHIALHLQQFLVADLLGAWVLGDGTGLFLDREQLRDIKALRVHHSSLGVARCDDAITPLGKNLRGERARVPEALDGYIRLLWVEVALLRNMSQEVGPPHRSGEAPALASAKLDGLAGDDPRGVYSGELLILVQHP